MSNGKILDCESPDSAYVSVEQILGLNRSQLDELFTEIDLDSIYTTDSHPDIPADTYLFCEVMKCSRLDGEYQDDCWFHLTRTLESNRFDNGILPLGHCIDSIWEFLYSLIDRQISRQQWEQFRASLSKRGGHYAYLYNMKVNLPQYWGPYAILVKDIAFKAKEVGAHDYFRVPEIVEDVCICFGETFRVSLLDAFRSSTRPCIVKFTAPYRDDALKKALYYLYHVQREETLHIECSTCFDGKGNPIPADKILKVEFPTYP